ncbi:MAG: sigma-70 family RNA polymerase sigma factor, partial [Actinomycetota bacterium]
SGSSPQVRGGAGVTDPFLAFYRAHVDALYRWVHRRCRDRALAEDIVQETFLAAARRADPVGEAWLYTVARNRLIDVVRRNERFNDRLHLVATDAANGSEDGELLARLELIEALELLRAEHRIVLQLKYVDGMTVDALASEIGRTPKAAEALLSRAREALRSALRGLDD